MLSASLAITLKPLLSGQSGSKYLNARAKGQRLQKNFQIFNAIGPFSQVLSHIATLTCPIF